MAKVPHDKFGRRLRRFGAARQTSDPVGHPEERQFLLVDETILVVTTNAADVSQCGGALSCLTRDHSLENELKARGQLFELANLSEHSRNALTRCIGQYTPLQVDFSEHDLCPGDRFLFCSDGITKMIREPEIAQALSASTDPAATAALLIQKANHRGGLDNATAVVIQVDSNS